MGYDIDYDYTFELADAWGIPFLPEGMAEDGDLYVLPNGKYLPPGVYKRRNGSTLIYEPRELSPWAGMLAQCTEP